MSDKMYEVLCRRINKLEKSNKKINEKLDLIIESINDLYDDDDDDDDCDDEDDHGLDWVKTMLPPFWD